MDRWIYRVLILLFAYILHRLDPGLTLWALVLVYPWMPESLDRFLVHKVYAPLLQGLHLPLMLRKRLTIALMYWPTILKACGIPLLWLLLVFPDPVQRMALWQGALVYSLVLAGVLVFTSCGVSEAEGEPVLTADKNLGYRQINLVTGVLAIVAGFFVWGSGITLLACAALWLSGIFCLVRFAGLNLPVLQIVLGAHCLLLLALLAPGRTGLLWIAGLMVLILTVPLPRAISMTRQKIRYNLLYYKLMGELDPQTRDRVKRERFAPLPTAKPRSTRQPH